MSYKFTVEMEIEENPFTPPKISIDGDLEIDDFAEPLLRGVIELLLLLRDIKGSEEVEKALRRLKTK